MNIRGLLDQERQESPGEFYGLFTDAVVLHVLDLIGQRYEDG